jgi:hypothetical protein
MTNSSIADISVLEGLQAQAHERMGLSGLGVFNAQAEQAFVENMSPQFLNVIDGFQVSAYSGELDGKKRDHVHVKKAGVYIEL